MRVMQITKRKRNIKIKRFITAAREVVGLGEMEEQGGRRREEKCVIRDARPPFA